ncbi:MAG: BCCT family transporter [Candidatus Adiutrix sp.]|jgi:choline/carnitine/betaine transport|nr:BCCT family transporter [Candidatus Adiutrix sp.]
MDQKQPPAKMDPIIVGVPLVLVAIFIIWGQVAGDNLGANMSKAFNLLTHDIGWLYLLFGFICILASLWLILGRYHHIKFGPPESKPEFSNFAWYAMIFACGNGIGIVYWSAAEPLCFFVGPPLHIAAETAEAAAVALAWTLFHWGWTPWAFYLVLTIPIGYFAYRRGRSLRYSSALPESLRHMWGGVFAKMIDGILIFALVMGVITSLGLGIKQLASGLHLRYAVAESAGVFIFIGFLWAAGTVTSNLLGLRKGLSRLSNLNIVIAVVLMIFVFLFGPTRFIMDMGANALGFIIDRFAVMSLWTDPVEKGGFPQGWTTFYWAWWLAWAPILCVFVARISKGRTIREIVVVHMVVAVFSSYMWFTVFGSTSLNMAMTTNPEMLETIKGGATSTAIFSVLDNLPISGLTTPVFMFLLFVFLTTTADSAAFICSQMSTTDVAAQDNPPMFGRAFWSLVMTGVAIYLVIFSEGISALQLSSLLPSLLVIIFYFMAYTAFIKDVNKHEFPPEIEEPFLKR